MATKKSGSGTPEPGPAYPYSLTQRRDRGENASYRIERAGKIVIWIDPRERLYDTGKEIVNYLNRDRREVVFIEERLFLAESRLAELAKLCGIMVTNLHWCVEQVPVEHRKRVDGWSDKARKILKEVMGDKWK